MVAGIDTSSKYKVMLDYFRGFLPLRSVPLSRLEPRHAVNAQAASRQCSPVWRNPPHRSASSAEPADVSAMLGRWKHEERVFHEAMIAISFG